MDRAAVADLLSGSCATYGVPGAQVGLLRGDERVVACHGTAVYGDVVPVDRAMRFHAGSIAKGLTVLVVLDAAARGELELDVPCDEQVAGLWPDTPLAIMAQTTGRPNVLPEVDQDLASFVAQTSAMPRVHEAGRFSYCNAGWSVLDLLLEGRTGRGFEALARSRVLGAATSFGAPAHHAAGHGVAPGQPPTPVPDFSAVAASAAGSRWWVTCDELLDFAALLLDLLALLGVPPLPPPALPATGRPASELAGAYGPATLVADGADLLLEAPAFGLAVPLRHVRTGGDTFVADGAPPGGMSIAVDGDLLYVGPFALPRS